MQPNTNDLLKLEDIPDKFKDHFYTILEQVMSWDEVEKDILLGKKQAVVTRQTPSGKKLMAWKKNEKNKRKRARKARRKNR